MSRLMAELANVDRQIERASLSPVPDGLRHRILLARRHKPVWHYAAAAVIALGISTLALVLPNPFDATMLPSPVQAVGPSHPAVAAISLVVDGRTELAEQGNTAEMTYRLKQLGLALDKREVHAYYAGKCHLFGGECDLIVLDAPDARANVILLPDYPFAGRVLLPIAAWLLSSARLRQVVMSWSPTHQK